MRRNEGIMSLLKMYADMLRCPIFLLGIFKLKYKVFLLSIIKLRLWSIEYGMWGCVTKINKS